MYNFRKLKRNSIKILQRNRKNFVNNIKVEYDKVNVRLSDSQLNKPKSAIKNQTGITLRMNIKNVEGSNLPHGLLQTTRQKANLRNAFENNLLTDIKLYKTQISKIIQSGGSLGSLLS